MTSAARLWAGVARFVVSALVASTLTLATGTGNAPAGNSPSSITTQSGTASSPASAQNQAEPAPAGGVGAPEADGGSTPPVRPTGEAPPGPSRPSTTGAGERGSGFSPGTREASQQLWDQLYQATNDGAIGWTGGSIRTCTPGSTSLQFQQGVLNRINYFRAMAGVGDDITFDSTYNTKAQAAALMMSANQALSHSPPADWDCFSSDGHEGAGHSNLYLRVLGAAAVTGYMLDPGASNAPVGHRRWVLFPQTQQMGTGDIPASNSRWGSNALWVVDSHIWDPRPATREEYVAWPPPGYVPDELVFPRWSFSYPGANFAHATVTMTKNGSPATLVQHRPHDGYGENTLVWEPRGTPHPNDVYQVSVSQVLIDGNPRTFSYQVTAFSPDGPQPDVRLRFGSDLVGDDIYNTTGAGQTANWNGGAGSVVTNRMSVQNDGTSPQRLRVKASASSAGLTIRYLTRGIDITSRVVAGTYLTPSLAPGAAQNIKVVATLTNAAPINATLTRRFTATSTADTTRKDTAKIVYSRVH